MDLLGVSPSAPLVPLEVPLSGQRRWRATTRA